MKHIPVIICGAGPVGMSLSLALHRFGIDHICLDKHPGTAIHPKARGVNIRTMELFRLWEIEEAIRSHELPSSARKFVWRSDLHKEAIATLEIAPHPSLYSPTTSCLVTQDFVEQVLHQEIVKQCPDSLRFNTKLIKFIAKDDAVECTLLNLITHKEETLCCDYLVASDGAHSPIRQQLGIPMNGISDMGCYLSILCQFELKKVLDDPNFIVSVFTQPQLRGKFMMAVNLVDKIIIAERQKERRQQHSQDDCMKLIRAVIKDDMLPVNILNQSTWEMAALNAKTYRSNRIFLVGDAAHRLPPTGGMGMNTGIQDAHNLAWKLHYVLSGYAAPLLLDSYHYERRPVAQATIDWSASNAHRLTDIFEAIENNDHRKISQLLEQQQEQLNHLGLDLGYCYPSTLVPHGEDVKIDLNPNVYHPSTDIGARAPHCWIIFKNKRLSTLDLYEKDYVLLTRPPIGLTDLQQNLPVPPQTPIKHYALSVDITAESDDFLSQYFPENRQAILIRPDGHVAWQKNNSL